MNASFQAGFARVDITPPLGVQKMGWMADLPTETILDPLHARVVVLANQSERIAIFSLDVLSLRWRDIQDIRQRIEEAFGFPASNILIAATHNHAGPFTGRGGIFPHETHYIETLKTRCVEAFGEAWRGLQPAEIGFSRVLEFDVAFNRRTVTRDGTVQTQLPFLTGEALYPEGPVDPEVAVWQVRSTQGRPLGAFVQFACHPVDHGGTREISSGWPGLLAAKVEASGVPVCLFLNGAYGNVLNVDFRQMKPLSMEATAEKLFADYQSAVGKMALHDRDPHLASASRTLQLSFRDVTDDEYHGRVRGAQRFCHDSVYEGEIDRLRKKIQHRGTQRVEIQVLQMGNWYFAGIPAEYFVEFQLNLKTSLFPKDVYVVGGANGMIGYVPTLDAFQRGGYETTLGPTSFMAPQTGDRIAEAVTEIILGLTPNPGGPKRE